MPVKTIYEVGKQFPGAIPKQEGATMEIGTDGALYIIIQMPGISRDERRAFKKSFKKYPDNIIDTNIASDYGKIQKLFSIRNENFNNIGSIIKDGEIAVELVAQFSRMVKFYVTSCFGQYKGNSKSTYQAVVYAKTSVKKVMPILAVHNYIVFLT